MSAEWPESATRPLYWSVRRELWENRSIYLAPLVVAAFALFASSINTIVTLPNRMRTLWTIEPAKQQHALSGPFSMIAAIILFTGFVVAAFYCIDALYGERRDRSILFWKSLPVSDRTAVLSKAAVPLVVVPLLTYVIAIAAQTILLLMSAVVLAGNGLNPLSLWTRLPLFEMSVVMLYGLTAHVLWYAPIYGWLLLVSAWARRVVILWALAPFVAILIFERIALDRKYFSAFLRYRLIGAMGEAFAAEGGKNPVARFSELSPLRFLTSPGLWLGLLFAAACLAVAVRLRRHRESI